MVDQVILKFGINYVIKKLFYIMFLQSRQTVGSSTSEVPMLLSRQTLEVDLPLRDSVLPKHQIEMKVDFRSSAKASRWQKLKLPVSNILGRGRDAVVYC